jgi:ornithine cyclodeaminase/alanine dehydrogenase-like protein (mu-crystallin family)
VEATYRLHGAGDSVNPPSFFLRFPDRPSSRIIALPASLGGPLRVDGLKWISSFPGNTGSGLPRASAVLILNDPDTGYPYACLESSVISATRTASSAALAADRLSQHRTRPLRVGFVGTGLIARYIHTHLRATGWEFEETGVYDLSADSAEGFRAIWSGRGRRGASRCTTRPKACPLQRPAGLRDGRRLAACARSGVVRPPSAGPARVVAGPRSRDPAGVGQLRGRRGALSEGRHLAASGRTATGGREFIDGTLDDVLTGRVSVPTDRTVVFSPFGLGVLDLAVGRFVHDEVARRGELRVVDGFFHELRRYG